VSADSPSIFHLISRVRAIIAGAAIVVLCNATLAHAQQLGYKLLGSAGIDAGVQPPAGLAIIDRVLHYQANELRGRNGELVPIDGLEIRATGMALGAALTTEIKHETFLTFSFALPLARLNVNSDRPEASINGFGFADMFVQPLRVGWRHPHFDFATAYNVYVPTGKFEPRRGGVGAGHWTHQLSLGGALFSDTTRRNRASAMASYEMNTRKRGIDIRRGDLIQIQGGAGVGVAKVLTIGVASFAQWQVTADHGADIPPSLRGQWSRAFGVGPEVIAVIPSWRTKVELRIERDLGVRSRPKGQVIAFGASYAMPRKRR
jgi:hypothetical protein